jgi:phage regulator Rha-like protein
MANLVTIEKQELMTTSLIIAEGVNYEHRTVLKTIRENEKDISDLGIITLGVRKSKRGKPTEFYILNEGQVYFVMTLLQNNEYVKKFKKELVREFMRMRKALISIQVMQQNKEWQQARIDGKAVRKETTDAIKDFVEYAVMQGSKSAVRYYGNITTMENKALFILEQKFENVREVLNNHQLSTIKIADRIVYESLQEGMERGMHYKDIFKLAKERVETLATLVKPTIVISATEIKLIE